MDIEGIFFCKIGNVTLPTIRDTRVGFELVIQSPLINYSKFVFQKFSKTAVRITKSVRNAIRIISAKTEQFLQSNMRLYRRCTFISGNH